MTFIIFLVILSVLKQKKGIFKKYILINFNQGGLMKITSTFNENGKTLQDIMEQFLIIYFNENIGESL